MQGNTTNFGPAPWNNTTGLPPGNTNNNCFECGQTGHYARNCPHRHRQGQTKANLIDFDEEYDNYEGFETPNRVNNIKQQLNAMSLNEKAKLAEEMGVSEDFPTA